MHQHSTNSGHLEQPLLRARHLERLAVVPLLRPHRALLEQLPHGVELQPSLTGLLLLTHQLLVVVGQRLDVVPALSAELLRTAPGSPPGSSISIAPMFRQAY